MNASFLACNRKKRSLAVDLKIELGREIAYKLIATADVLVHNVWAGAAERIGLGEDALRAFRHDLIVRRQLFLPMSDNYFCRWSPG